MSLSASLVVSLVVVVVVVVIVVVVVVTVVVVVVGVVVEVVVVVVVVVEVVVVIGSQRSAQAQPSLNLLEVAETLSQQRLVLVCNFHAPQFGSLVHKKEHSAGPEV